MPTPLSVFREIPLFYPSAPQTQAPNSKATTASAAPADDVKKTPFAKLLQNLSREIDTGKNQVQTALASSRAHGPLGPEELLALQAGIYRYSEAIDLASKLVDRASNGIKTVLQAQ